MKRNLQFSTKCNVSNLISKLFQLRNEHVKTHAHTQMHIKYASRTRCQLRILVACHCCLLVCFEKSFQIVIWNQLMAAFVCTLRIFIAFRFISFQLCAANTFVRFRLWSRAENQCPIKFLTRLDANELEFQIQEHIHFMYLDHHLKLEYWLNPIEAWPLSMLRP